MKTIIKQVHFLNPSFLKGFLLLFFFALTPTSGALVAQYAFQKDASDRSSIGLNVNTASEADDPNLVGRTTSKTLLRTIFGKETALKTLAEKAERVLYMPPFPGGTRIFTPKMQGTVWGEPDQMTLSLLKTDVIDRRIVARKPFTVDEIVKGAFSDANKDFDDMPHSGSVRAIWGVLTEEGGRRDFEAWSQQYPFPCQKPVGQVIVSAGNLKGGKRPVGTLSLSNGEASVRTSTVTEGASSLELGYLLAMKRNIVAIDCHYENLSQDISFRLYRHQDQGHRRYMDEKGNYIPEKQRKVVFTPADPTQPLEYYDIEADADMNGPFAPPTSGMDGRFFWVSQKFPAEATFPEGFEYVMMGLCSDLNAQIHTDKLQKGLGTIPKMKVDRNGKVIIEKGSESHFYMLDHMRNSYELFGNAPGTAATALIPISDGGTGSVRIYIAVVTSNEADDIFSEARKQLLDAEKMGYEGLVKENKDWYDNLYDRREEGRIAVEVSGTEKDRINRMFVENAFESWAISDGGYCDPDPRKYEGSEVYVGYDIDMQNWHTLPCYNEVFSEPMMVWNRHEPYLYYCRLIEAWYEGLKGKAQAIYGLPGIVLPHGYLPPVKPNPWYIENQTLDLCLDVSGQVMKVLWNMWDYQADEEMFKSLIYPAVRDLATFFEAFARRNYDGKYYNLQPVVETENWGISYKLKYATNTTAAIAMFRKILNCAIEGAQLQGIDEDRIPGWREVAENLPPYTKFMVATGEVLAGNSGVMPRYSSGDHPYFTGDFPATLADEITLDSPEEDRDLIARTYDVTRAEWNTNTGIVIGKFKDYTPCNINHESLLIKDHEMLVKEFIGPSNWLVQEDPMPLTSVAWPERPGTERLLNSRGGRIHLFPVVPDWSEVAFREFQARGGFLVSAAKDKDGVTAVVIKARRSIPCRLMNPWEGKKISVTDIASKKPVRYELDVTNGECIIFDAQSGHEYSIDPA